ncbi:hypothetical protein ACLM5J_02675 [Nocardioides sp. Bht2]|uniref:hypothetical protein n=1 Tax=Nocardioides sp. Bht2 TaxID=3392297 RepID=UPI0039B42AA0
MSHDHDHDHDHDGTEDLTISVAAQALADENGTHQAEVSFDQPGLHIALVEMPDTASDAGEWELDPEADLGLKIMLGGLDPEMAVQLLQVAIDFLSDEDLEQA